MIEKDDEHIFLSLKDSSAWVKGLSAWALAPAEFRGKKSFNKVHYLTICPGKFQIITQTL